MACAAHALRNTQSCVFEHNSVRGGTIMEIAVTQDQGRVPVTIFHITGPVTSNEELEGKAKEAIAGGAHDLLLDLAGVPYMATSGLRALNNMYTMLRTDAPGESDAAVKAGVAAGTY